MHRCAETYPNHRLQCIPATTDSQLTRLIQFYGRLHKATESLMWQLKKHGTGESVAGIFSNEIGPDTDGMAKISAHFYTILDLVLPKSL